MMYQRYLFNCSCRLCVNLSGEAEVDGPGEDRMHEGECSKPQARGSPRPERFARWRDEDEEARGRSMQDESVPASAHSSTSFVSSQEQAMDAMKWGLACGRVSEGSACMGWLSPWARRRWLLLYERLHLHSIESEVHMMPSPLEHGSDDSEMQDPVPQDFSPSVQSQVVSSAVSDARGKAEERSFPTDGQAPAGARNLAVNETAMLVFRSEEQARRQAVRSMDAVARKVADREAKLYGELGYGAADDLWLKMRLHAAVGSDVPALESTRPKAPRLSVIDGGIGAHEEEGDADGEFGQCARVAADHLQQAEFWQQRNHVSGTDEGPSSLSYETAKPAIGGESDGLEEVLVCSVCG